MQTFKILIGALALLLAWTFLYRTRFIFKLNSWIRENIFSDRLVLFSNRRMAVLLLVLGIISLFSGIKGLDDMRPIKPKVAAQMMEQAREEYKKKAYPQVVSRCRELVKSNPKNVEAAELLAGAWWALGQKEKAVQAIQSLIYNNPSYEIGLSPLNAILVEKRKEKN